MSNLFILFLSFSAGHVVQYVQKVERNQVSLLNSFILYVSLPAQIFLHIPVLKFNIALFKPICVSWIIFLFSFLFFNFLGKILKLKKTTVICFILVCGLGNTSFVGLPLIDFYFGSEGVGIGIYVDQFGTFLSLCLLGLPYLLSVSSNEVKVINVLKRVLSFPPFIAIIIAIVMNLLGITPGFNDVLKRLGDTLAPMALFSVGVQLNFKDLKGRIFEIILGLSYKLFFAPLLIYVIYIIILGGKGIENRVSVFEASMGPMITSTLLVAEKKIEPELASILLSIGIIISFVTSNIWYKVLLNL